VPDLPHALRTLASDAVVTTEDEAHPAAELRANGVIRWPGGILSGCGTSVPFTAVLAGPERTATDNTTAAATCTARPTPR
jgi:hypothetical protein